MLAVDDDATNRVLVRRMLAKVGCTCDELEDGDLVAQRLEETGQLAPEAAGGNDSPAPPVSPLGRRPYDMLLLDIVMARTSGDVVLADLCRRGLRMPAFAMTANVSAVDRKRYLAAGFAGIVSKPFDVHMLRGAVSQVVAEMASGAAAAGPR